VARFSLTIWILLLGLCMACPCAQTKAWDRGSDTWVATDALGRSVSTNEQAGNPRPGKFVGIFYFLWLGEHGQGGPYDNTKILAADPDAMKKSTSPPWGPLNQYHYWGEPLFGYYLSDDPWVYRKHAQMLADAGVAVVIFDVTNQYTYKKSYTALCDAWTKARTDGGATPQIAFLCPFWDAGKVVRELYNDLYGKNLYPDLWFRWKGKPLILAAKEQVDPDLREFFTFREGQPNYFKGPERADQWAWLETYPQHGFYNSERKVEQVAVSVAQNAKNGKLAALSEAGSCSRSWHNGKLDDRPGAVNLGLNFAEQWEQALKLDPEFVFITGWNEWIAMRLDDVQGVREPAMFMDQFNQEGSRDIEPMKGGHGDDYYYQMVDYIRRFRGARRIPAAGKPKTIKIDGDFSDWTSVTPEYRDEIGDTMYRDHPGWGSVGRYANVTGRNDIITSKVSRDKNNVYFYVKTREPITARTDPSWMMLFINSDSNPKTGWEGYDYVVNRKVTSATRTVIEKFGGRWDWKRAADVGYRVMGCEMELAIPRAALGLADAKKRLSLDFKWADNTLVDGDIMVFTVNGDAAPDGRFAYRFVEK
jgi:hypothetical protein